MNCAFCNYNKSNICGKIIAESTTSANKMYIKRPDERCKRKDEIERKRKKW